MGWQHSERRRELGAAVTSPEGNALEGTDACRGLQPAYWLLSVPVVLIAVYLLAGTSPSTDTRDAANLIGPLTLGLAAGVAALRLVRRCPQVVWTPYAWFLLAVILFYSAGPLLYPLAGSETVLLASSLYQVTPDELLRTNLLDAVGVLSVLVGSWVAWQLRGRLAGQGTVTTGGTAEHTDATGPLAARSWENVGASTISPKAVALVFLLVGGALQYLVILPARFGITDTVMPGVVWNLGRLHLLGIALLAYVVAGGSRFWRVPLAVLWTAQLAVSVLLFSKLELILTLVLPALGAYASHRRIKRLVLWGLVTAAVYLSVPQFVLYGRAQIHKDTGTIYRAGLRERAAIVRQWFASGMPSLDERTSPISTAWARLNYAPVQAFVMARYDAGFPGQRLRDAAIVLVPRVFWPDKPVTTEVGMDFYELMTGRRGSYLGLGIFGEGYWHYGWAGVVGLGMATGVVFALVSGLAVGWMRRRAFVYLPSVVLGIQMGAVGTTGSFVNGVVGGGGLLGTYALAAWALVELLQGRRRPVVPSEAGSLFARD
jgi:hypothetical protein